MQPARSHRALTTTRRNTDEKESPLLRMGQREARLRHDLDGRAGWPRPDRGRDKAGNGMAARIRIRVPVRVNIVPR